MNKEEANQKILKLMNKKNNLSKKEIELFKELILQCDLKQQYKYGWTPFMYVLNNNKEQNLNLSKEQWDYLIKNSDLKQQNNNGWNPFMYALYYNKSQNLNLTKDQFDYLLKNSDLKTQNEYGRTPLIYALKYNKTQNLNLTIKQFQTMYKALDKDQKQNTFKNLIQENASYNDKYIEEINLLLYDFKFEPDIKIISWLKEKKYQDILEMIEKRDLLYHLENNLNHQKNNHQKIAKIKI